MSSSGLETSSANSGMTQPCRDDTWTQFSVQIVRRYSAYMCRWRILNLCTLLQIFCPLCSIFRDSGKTWEWSTQGINFHRPNISGHQNVCDYPKHNTLKMHLLITRVFSPVFFSFLPICAVSNILNLQTWRQSWQGDRWETLTPSKSMLF